MRDLWHAAKITWKARRVLKAAREVSMLKNSPDKTDRVSKTKLGALFGALAALATAVMQAITINPALEILIPGVLGAAGILFGGTGLRDALGQLIVVMQEAQKAVPPKKE